MYFLIWGSFLSDDSSLCQVDIKLARTVSIGQRNNYQSLLLHHQTLVPSCSAASSVSPLPREPPRVSQIPQDCSVVAGAPWWRVLRGGWWYVVGGYQKLYALFLEIYLL